MSKEFDIQIYADISSNLKLKRVNIYWDSQNLSAQINKVDANWASEPHITSFYILFSFTILWLSIIFATSINNAKRVTVNFERL